MYTNRLAWILGACLAFALLPCAANANSIAFDSFGPSDSYESGFRYSAGQSFLFVAAESWPLASITVALGRSSEAVTSTTFYLFEASESGFGALLESLTTPNETEPLPGTGAVVEVESIEQPVLQAGASYWLAFNDSQGFGSLWFFNDQGFFGPRNQDPFELATLPAFRVEVIPEPGTGVLLLSGLLLLQARSGPRSRRQSR